MSSIKHAIEVLLLSLAVTMASGCGKTNPGSLPNDTSDGAAESTLARSASPAISSVEDKIADWPPSPSHIQADLIGHDLSEGVRDGYFPNYWIFEIEYGNIKDFYIEKVLTQTDNKYMIVANINLSTGGNFYYRTKARINYVKDAGGPCA